MTWRERWLRAARRAASSVREQWRAQVEMWDRWAARQEPWRAEGPLRWRRVPGGWQLDGRHLPAPDGADRREADHPGPCGSPAPQP